MTITKRVQKELVQSVPPSDNQLLKSLRTNSSSCTVRVAHKARSAAERNKGKAWTREEHARFLVALDVYPSGPWKAIADYVGTKDSRQTMTHAQKYRQKHERQQRGLRNRNKGTKKKQKTQTRPQPSENVELLKVAIDDEADVAMADVTDFSEPPQPLALVKQLSDSPRSADEAVNCVNNDPFAPVVVDDSLFSLALDAETAWVGTKTGSDLMDIFAGFDEPLADAAWPQMWSTNSLDEIMATCSQFDFPSEDGAQ